MLALLKEVQSIFRELRGSQRTVDMILTAPWSEFERLTDQVDDEVERLTRAAVSDDEGPPDLTRADCYEGTVIPNADYETALKVIRTVRNFCLGPLFFDADGAVVLSHAHANLVRLAQACEGQTTPDEHHDVGGDAGGA